MTAFEWGFGVGALFTLIITYIVDFFDKDDDEGTGEA